MLLHELGHGLGFRITAECVETQAQADFLRAHGCDEAQGYHLGRPLKEEAFEALLEDLLFGGSNNVHEPLPLSPVPEDHGLEVRFGGNELFDAAASTGEMPTCCAVI